MTILLKEIDHSNYKECANLTVSEAQENFVAANWYSLLEAKYEPNRLPFGIYDNEELVGFLMFSYHPADEYYDKDSWWIERFMLDQKQQRKGYGTKALKVAINDFKQTNPDKELRISAEPANDIAITLYEKQGFTKTGEYVGDEVVLLLQK
ncbi:diamine N-acetyltransferase [Amphibacillus marinus]|uniref:Diamine N-acetyltransferase n=1 Tax=Amphibacillus marinus TaxID=872970 RepID=A0A1H8LSC7_9BACI|nr:GNAT family N-acetyltransferase [Amphibacillus marinus]SEO08052.1 diamine N-acetyltransferase [Amphibacillus marinus]